MVWADRFVIFLGILYGAVFYRMPFGVRLHIVRVGFLECFSRKRWL